MEGGAATQLSNRLVVVKPIYIYKKIWLGHLVGNFKLNLLVKENWNLVDEWNFFIVECVISFYIPCWGVGSHR